MPRLPSYFWYANVALPFLPRYIYFSVFTYLQHICKEQINVLQIPFFHPVYSTIECNWLLHVRQCCLLLHATL